MAALVVFIRLQLVACYSSIVEIALYQALPFALHKLSPKTGFILSPPLNNKHLHPVFFYTLANTTECGLCVSINLDPLFIME